MFKRYKVSILSLLILFILSSFLGASINRIMTYNVLQYSGGDADKNQALRDILAEIDPDVLMAEEIHNTTGYNAFLNDVMNYDGSDTYAGAPFIDQSYADMDIALFYKPDLFTFVSTTTVNTTSSWGLRDALEVVLHHEASGLDIRFYGVHLKANSGSDNEAIREAEAIALRNYLNDLPANTPFVVMGDFNVYTSSEGAFQVLTNPGDDADGQIFDPINRIGDWHNNAGFADVHTQSPRANFGGMDDRFDILLTSGMILDDTAINYAADSYTPYGNDGNHFNQGINEGTNTAVSADIADALVEASDHLPVYMDLVFEDLINSSSQVVITEIMPNPAMVSDSYGEWFEIYNADTTALDLNGWIIRDDGTNQHVISSGGSLMLYPGDYMVFGRNSDSGFNGGAPVSYAYSNVFLSNTEDEIKLFDADDQLVDVVEYSQSFPYGVGSSMYLADPESDNNDITNWSESTVAYGDGDLGTPGRAWDDTLGTENDIFHPQRVSLIEAYPNPFNGRLTISLSMNGTTPVNLDIIDLNGRVVDSRHFGRPHTGEVSFHWTPPANLASGIYWIRTRQNNERVTRKILYLK